MNKASIKKTLLRLTEDKFRYYFQMCVLCAILSIVALTMGIMNIITGKQMLMIATLTFSAISFINFLILILQKENTFITYGIFEISMIVLFTYFLMTGGTEGFSPHWILILPACGVMFLGKKRGAFLSIIMFVIVVLFLDVPYFRDIPLYDFTPEFRMRFPVVYVSFFALGYCFEMTRLVTYNAMVKAQLMLAEAAEKDPLTKMGNRHWFNTRIRRYLNGKESDVDCSALMIDIDNFKKVNDEKGHLAGDDALASVASAITACLNADDFSCRWGGEEFFVFMRGCDGERARIIADDILNAVRKITIHDEEGRLFGVTVSIGGVIMPKGVIMDARRYFASADKNLYKAKADGKDRVVFE